jgi:hypothetical protein
MAKQRAVNIDDPLEVAVFLGMLFGIRYMKPHWSDDHVDRAAVALYSIQKVPAAVVVDSFREGAKSVRTETDPKLAEQVRTEIDQLEKMLPKDDQPEAA